MSNGIYYVGTDVPGLAGWTQSDLCFALIKPLDEIGIDCVMTGAYTSQLVVSDELGYAEQEQIRDQFKSVLERVIEG